MKKIIKLLMLIALLIVVGCEDGGKIKVVNNTSYNLYTSIENKDYTIAGNSEISVEVSTDDKVFLLDDGETKKNITIVGETYSMYDSYQQEFPTTTSVKVNPGETTKIYCSPNYSSLKVINNYELGISKIRFRQVNQFVTQEWNEKSYAIPFNNGDFRYIHLVPQTEENRFWYNFEVQFEDGTVIPYGTEYEGHFLNLDEQYLIEYNN